MILPEGGNMQTHLNAMDECMDELATLGQPLADDLSVALYLSSLSESYSVLITAIESRAEADLNKNMVKNKLLEEYRRRQDTENVKSEQALKVIKDSNSFDKTKAFFSFARRKATSKSIAVNLRYGKARKRTQYTNKQTPSKMKAIMMTLWNV